MEIEIKGIQNCNIRLFLERLQMIYAAMDHQYNQAAAYYRFDCHTCTDNCCRTRFYHHTYVEYLYIIEGVKTLNSKRQFEIKQRALEIYQKSAELDKQGKPVRLMCPMNVDNLCILYPYRPMICRLHGIPHELQKSASSRVYGPGCETFDGRCSEKSYFKFDRTSFYVEMAALENKFKQTAGIAGKIKLTIAEMIADEKL
jgi:Fe-S-cluster containining protein